MACKSNGVNECFDEIKIPVPWGHIAAKWWGKLEERPVLALHGWQDNAGSFDGLAPLMVKNNIPVLAIDLPGHGLSSPYPDGMYYHFGWDGAILIRRIVKYFKWNTVTLMGHSLGSAIAFMYAAIYPDEVDKLIQIDLVALAVTSYKPLMKMAAGGIDALLKYETYEEKNKRAAEYDTMIETVYDAQQGHCSRKGCEILMKRGMRPIKEKSKSNGTLNGENKNGHTVEINSSMFALPDEEEPMTYMFRRDPRLKAIGLGYMNITDALEFARRIKCSYLNLRATIPRKEIDLKSYKLLLDEISLHAGTFQAHVIEGKHHFHLDDPESIIELIVEFLDNC